MEYFDRMINCMVLTLSQTIPDFYVCTVKVFENTVGKVEIARYEQFLPFPQYFLPFWRTFSHVIKFKIVVCNLFQFGSLKFVVWDRVNAVFKSNAVMSWQL